MSITTITRTAIATVAASAALVAVAPAADAAAPTDPQASSQQPLSILRVPQALDLAGRPLQDVPVLVADTGLDLQHPDLAPRLYALPSAVAAPSAEGAGGTVQAGRPGWDLIGTNAPGALAPDDDPDDPPGGSGHGTMVAGVLGAAWNNGVGGAGVAPNARFVALRTCWDGDECFQSVQAPAIDWAAARGARVASFSWLSGPLEDGLRDAIVSHPQTLFVTIPSGNGGAFDADGDDPQPCGLDAPNVLCVSTSAPDDGLDCGAFGPRSVDVAVPTRNNITTTNGGGFGPTSCATSFAAPTAAGVATILFGIDPSASPADVRAAIIDSARKVPAWAGKSTSGGIVDAAAAVTLFQQRRGIAPGNGGGGGAGDSQDRTKPSLTVGGGRVSRGFASFSVRVSEPGTVRFAIERRLSGRRASGRCRPATAANRRRPRCVRWAAQRTQSITFRDGTAGVGADAKTRKVRLAMKSSSGKRLPSGTYRVVVRATDAAGNRSATRTVTLR
ncbi:S8 family serine peptidase [Patulibacter medicamentivorans]|uniref:S8 family serine peptidase n=1 Tax=Patulibacter medicamentivorans TaxID=1097667 RepID=UPI00058F1A12|nr:S8 family serine peptidase [Patulibacter medicamentivorans]